MVTAGINIGTETTKAVILNKSMIVSWHTLVGGDEDAGSLAEKALHQAAAKAEMNPADIQNIVATGLVYGNVPFVSKLVPEAICIAKSVNWLFPSTRIALDLGAGKSVAIKCLQGRATKIARNDKCAFGTGKYLDVVGKVLGIRAEEMADLPIMSEEYIEVQSMCVVFAESEVVSLLHAKNRPEEIARGAIRGLAKKIYPLLVEVGLEKDITLVGGGARNKALVSILEGLIGYNVLIPPEPQIVAALGASIIAKGE
jgi:predicted CoA-substrate-specific enzyme activase